MATALIDSSFPAISSLLEAAPSVAGTACASYMKAATALMAARLGLVERSVTVDGLPWTYLERPAVGVSTAGGRTTILLHGMSMSLHEFIPCAHALRSLPGRLLLLPYLGHDDDARPLPDGRLKRHPDVDEPRRRIRILLVSQPALVVCAVFGRYFSMRLPRAHAVL